MAWRQRHENKRRKIISESVRGGDAPSTAMLPCGGNIKRGGDIAHRAATSRNTGVNAVAARLAALSRRGLFAAATT